MKAGTAIRYISPKGPIQLCGYPESPVSAGIHDELYLAAFYFSDGDSEFLFLTADLCFFARYRADQIRAAVRSAIGNVHILLAATHTHYAPATDCDIYQEAFGPELCPNYMAFVQEMAVEASCEAKAQAFEAIVSYGVGSCGKAQGIGGNRHDPTKYAQDPSVTVLRIQDAQHTVRGMLVGYALHPTLLPPTCNQVSADYVGALRQTILEAFPGAVFGFMQGCAGNQSSRYFRKEQSFAEANRFGCAIGQAALQAPLESLPPDTKIIARSVLYRPSRMRDIPAPEEANLKATLAKQQLDHLRAMGMGAAACRSAECSLIGAEQMQVYARDAARYGIETVLSTTTPVELEIVTLDKLAILGISAEVFADVGLAVKAAVPDRTVMFSCVTGGCSQSYICSDYAYEALYYEPTGSLFGRGAAEELAGVLTEQLKTLRIESCDQKDE